MWTKGFLLDAAGRPIRTFARALLASITVGDAVYHVDWTAGLGIAATAAIASLLTSVATSKVGDAGTAAIITPTPHTSGEHAA